MSVNGNGNVAALCEALELCKHELCEMCRRHNPGETCVNGCETIIRAKTALAANHPPKPDPDWAEICAKCFDGEVEPEECKYYGEPNGCNSPIYGEHPKASLGNNPAMREALATVIKIAAEIRGEYEIADSILKDGWATQLESIAKAALSIPPRNCDVGTAEEQIERFNEFCDSEWDSGNANCGNCPLWVSGTIGHNCQIRWAQMPYEAANESEAK